nr:proline-rich receptor-like protein kinase PERK8 [Lolium perenne]
MRTHKIGHMSGRLDPNRTSKVPLTKAQVASRVNHITKANLAEDWSYGLVPCDRNHPPARVFERQNVEDGDLATKRWTPDLVDPADQAGDHAGDDDLPQAPDLGGQGEHNPPPSPEHQEEEEPATSGTGPIPAVPLRSRPPSTTATSAPKGTKRAGSTAALEAKAKKQRRQQPKKVPEQAGAPIKFAQGGGSRQAPRVVSPLPRQRREQTPQPSSRAPTPPPPATGASSFAVPLASAPDRGTRVEPTRQPTLDDMFPRRTPLLGPSRRGRAGHAAFKRSRSRRGCS